MNPTWDDPFASQLLWGLQTNEAPEWKEWWMMSHPCSLKSPRASMARTLEPLYHKEILGKQNNPAVVFEIMRSLGFTQNYAPHVSNPGLTYRFPCLHHPHLLQAYRMICRLPLWSFHCTLALGLSVAVGGGRECRHSRLPQQLLSAGFLMSWISSGLMKDPRLWLGNLNGIVVVIIRRRKETKKKLIRISEEEPYIWLFTFIVTVYGEYA